MTDLDALRARIDTLPPGPLQGTAMQLLTRISELQTGMEMLGRGPRFAVEVLRERVEDLEHGLRSLIGGA